MKRWFDPWPVFFKREFNRNWPFLVGFAVTGTIITKVSLGLTEEDANHSKFAQRHKRGLAADGKLNDAKKYVLEMMGKGIRANAGTYAAVFEAYVKAEKVDEAKDLFQEMKEKGFVPDEKDAKEVVSNKRGQVFRSVINILFDK